MYIDLDSSLDLNRLMFSFSLSSSSWLLSAYCQSERSRRGRLFGKEIAVTLFPFTHVKAKMRIETDTTTPMNICIALPAWSRACTRVPVPWSLPRSLHHLHHCTKEFFFFHDGSPRFNLLCSRGTCTAKVCSAFTLYSLIILFFFLHWKIGISAFDASSRGTSVLLQHKRAPFSFVKQTHTCQRFSPDAPRQNLGPRHGSKKATKIGLLCGLTQ